jgi:signal transduction histidine kinase
MKRLNVPPWLYQHVTEEAMFAIAVFVESGECLYVNRMGVHLLNSSEPRLENLVPEQPHAQLKSFSPEFLENDGFYQDILIRNGNGGTFIANVGVRRIEADDIFGHVLMFQDVTLQKKLQREITAKQTEIKAAFEELLNQNRRLRELDLAKDRFVALTTHELRTPLAAMVAAAEILKMELYDSPEQMKEFIDMIYEQGLHLQDLVNDILDFAKIQAGKMEFYIEQRDIVPLTQSIVRQFEGMAESNSVSLKLELPAEKTPLRGYYDELRVRQILANIVNNAIKYNRKPGIVVITFAETDDLIKVMITDTGPGIPQDAFAKVFNEFETVGQVAEHHKGTGLGMPISRKLAEGMGGRLLLKSEVGVGSTFWVEIPKNKILEEGFYRPRPENMAVGA